MKVPGPLTGRTSFERYFDTFRRYMLSLKVQKGRGYRVDHTPTGTILHIEPAAGQGSPEKANIRCAVIYSMTPGILHCRDISYVDRPVESNRLYRVAMPWALRADQWNNVSIILGPEDTDSVIEYVSATQRYIKKTIEGSTVKIGQAIWPPYQEELLQHPPHNPREGSVIWVAKPTGKTGVWMSESGAIVDVDDPLAHVELEYIDLNVDARSWHDEHIAYKVCQNDRLYDVLLAAGPHVASGS